MTNYNASLKEKSINSKCRIYYEKHSSKIVSSKEYINDWIEKTRIHQDDRRKKTTLEQREILIQFMEEHPDLAQNRIQGLEARKQAAHLWEQLTNELNSCGHGATKSTEKWMKSWRDWRLDVKSKASKIRNYQKGTGGGGPSPASLQEIEKRLIALMGIESVIGHLSVTDPAEPENWAEQTHVTSITPSTIVSYNLSSNFPRQKDIPQQHTSQTITSLPDTHSSTLLPQQENRQYPQIISVKKQQPPITFINKQHPQILSTVNKQHSQTTDNILQNTSRTTSTDNKQHSQTTDNILQNTSRTTSTDNRQQSQTTCNTDNILQPTPQTISTAVSPYTYSPTHLPQQENTISQHTIQTHSSPQAILMNLPPSCEPSISEQSQSKRLKRQKTSDIRDIDIQILQEMRIQTETLKKLTDAVIDVAATIKHFMNVEVTSYANENDEGLIE